MSHRLVRMEDSCKGVQFSDDTRRKQQYLSLRSLKDPNQLIVVATSGNSAGVFGGEADTRTDRMCDMDRMCAMSRWPAQQNASSGRHDKGCDSCPGSRACFLATSQIRMQAPQTSGDCAYSTGCAPHSELSAARTIVIMVAMQQIVTPLGAQLGCR